MNQYPTAEAQLILKLAGTDPSIMKELFNQLSTEDILEIIQDLDPS